MSLEGDTKAGGDSNPRVGIIVLNWNNYDDTSECLEALQSQVTYQNYTVRVVDNNSSDGSYQRLVSEFPEFEFIQNEENLGFAGGNNVAINQLLPEGVEYILLLNNDAILTEGALQTLVKSAEKWSEVGIIGGKVIDTETGALQSTGFRQSTKFPFYKREGEPDQCWTCDYVHGCAVLIDSEVFQEIGLLDDDFFLYVEEREFYLRAQKSGYQIAMNPNATIYHEGMGSSDGNLSPLVAYWKVRNLFRCWRKHFPKYYLLTFLPYMVAFSIVHFNLHQLRQLQRTPVIRAIVKAWIASFTKTSYDEDFKP